MNDLETGTPQVLDPVVLSRTQSPEDHPFASADHYDGDLALLNYLLQDLRVVARQFAAGDTHCANHQSIEWEVHGLKRRTVLCDVDRLIEPTTRQIVGFFGDRRMVMPEAKIDATELDVVSQFRHFPGIISYSSIELVNDQWANLVVHSRAEDRSDWRHSKVHIEAAEKMAPKIYHNVRIHNGCIPGGAIGSETIVVETTKYWDYDGSPVWHAFRTLTGGLAEIVEPANQGRRSTDAPGS